MTIAFAKMHGLGNDFMVVHDPLQTITWQAADVVRLADRRRGVGFDQLLVISDGDHNNHFGYAIFNADGTEVGQCGNGARCVAKWLWHQGIAESQELTLTSSSTSMRARSAPDGLIAVDMGQPMFDPAQIPLKEKEQATRYALECPPEISQLMGNNDYLEFGAVSVGNPHAVMVVDNVEQTNVALLGPWIQQSGRFPEGVNAGFMQVESSTNIRLRVYERGAGETQACGSGACAAVAVGQQNDQLESRVAVELRGGRLIIERDEQDHLWMTGPAVHVFDGRIEL